MSTADKNLADYVAYDWERVIAYDSHIRGQFSSSDPDPWSSNDERTFHLLRLTESARKTGDRKFVGLLLDWYSDHRFSGWTRLHMTILVSLVYATFYRTALSLFDRIMATDDKEWVIRGMIDSQVMFLSYAMHPPFFPDSLSVRWRDVLSDRKPWITKEEVFAEARQGFVAQLQQYRERNEGGWETNFENDPTA